MFRTMICAFRDFAVYLGHMNNDGPDMPPKWRLSGTGSFIFQMEVFRTCPQKLPNE